MFAQDKKKNPRNTAVFLDVIHIVLGIVIVVLPVITFISPEDHMMMFPLIFFAGAALNLITGAVHIRGVHEKRIRRTGYFQTVLGVLLLLLTMISAISIWR